MSDLKEKEKVDSSALSISSSSTAYSHHDTQFNPIRRLLIDAKGIGLIRLPVPSSELSIPIYHANGELAYTSTRSKQCSGDAILSHPKQGDIISTEYFFGPKRDPLVKVLADQSETRMKGKWGSRRTRFETGERFFEWSYASEKRDGEKINLLVLREVGESKDGRVVAQLVRGAETRAIGSSRSSAGNGGELLIDEGIYSIEESMVVATCLVMLKKEVDRRRIVQAAVIAGAAGS